MAHNTLVSMAEGSNGSGLGDEMVLSEGESSISAGGGFYGQDWNAMLSDWELGMAGESAREMSLFLSQSFPMWPTVV